MRKILLILTLLLTGMAAWAQKPGSTPVKISQEKQMLHGRKYYVHIVEKGQTVYSIARAYKVESYDAVCHVDIHALHPGDTVWLPFRGQFTESELDAASKTTESVPSVNTVYVRDTVYLNVHDTTYIYVPHAVHDTTYVNVPYAVHDTVYVDVPYTVTKEVVVKDTLAQTKYVTVRDTTYVDVPYAVHDTVYVDVPYTLTKETVVTDTVTKYVTVRDTTYVDAPYAVHDTVYVDVPYTVTKETVVTDTVTKYVTVRDTSYIDVPYAVHDTVYVDVPYTVTKETVVTDTVTKYVTIRDTSYVDVPYAVHDTVYVDVPSTVTKETVVTDTVTKYVTVRDTSYIDVPYAVHDTVYVDVPYTVTKETVVTDTVTKYVTVRDTSYIDVPYAVHDTVYVDVPYTVTKETVVTDTVTLTEYVPVHDTSYITLRDTTHINVPYAVHDTVYVDVPYTVNKETVVTDTLRLTEYVPVHDTTYITVHDTTYIDVPSIVHEKSIVIDTVTLTEYVAVHDTTYLTVHDTTYVEVPSVVHEKTIVTDTVTLREYVPVHDTTYLTVHDTTYVEVPSVVHEKTIVTDTVTLTEYVQVHDTTFLTVHDTTYVEVPSVVQTIVTDTVTLTEYVPVHDTTYLTEHDTTYVEVPSVVHEKTIVTDTVTIREYVQVHDTTYLTVYDTTYVEVPYAVHDTTYITDTIDLTASSSSALAYASASGVALTEYMQASQTTSSQDELAMDRKRRKDVKTLKVALMMPLYLNQIDKISTSKFDIEQRGKKSYRQFEFIEFYEGIQMALHKLAEEGVNVELNVVDVSDNSVEKVEQLFVSHKVAECDVLIALLLREAFDKAAALAREAGIYIVNPMATRSDLCAENPYMVKMQPAVSGEIAIILNNAKLERPDGHLYVIHSNTKAEREVLDEVKRQLDERGDIPYTIFNWSQNAKLAGVLKKTPSSSVLSIYDQGRDQNRVFAGNLLNRLAAFKQNTPTLYTLTDWTREYGDIDFAQLQQVSYHTFATSWDMTNEVHVQFLKDFRTNYGIEPTSSLAAMGYDLTMYIVDGLYRHGADFWKAPVGRSSKLTQPIRLGRRGAGVENERATLYKMDQLHLVPAQVK